MKQLTPEQAIKFSESGAWEELSLIDRARFQLEQDLLCMPFDKFREAIEKALGRPVWTHEFIDQQRLKDELYELKPKATFDEIMEMIPEGKRIIVVG